MEAELKVCGKEFNLKSKLVSEGVKFPNSEDETLHNQFKISVKVDGMTKKFNFYGSMSDYEAGKKDLTEEGLKDAFRCLIDDGNAGDMSFEDFCSEFGYDTDSRKAEKIHKECGEILDKLLDLGLLESELPDILNELSEQGVE